MRFPRKEPLRAKNSAEAVRIQWIFPWSTTNGRFTTFVDWLMVLRVPLADYGYDSSQRRPHAPGCSDGVPWLRSVVVAGERLDKKANKADLPPHFGAP